MNYDPLSGLPTKKKKLSLGPGPAEPKSPLLGGYGGAPLATPTSAPGDPIAAPIGPTSGGSPVGPAPVASPKDLEAILQSDPLYKQAQADIQAARVTDQASRTAARQRALVLYGDVPDFSQAAGSLGLVGNDIGGDITDTVRGLANTNSQAGLSTLSRLKQANGDAVKQIQDQLTARGILSSGETGYQLGRQDLSMRTANYDALQQLLDYLGGIQNDYLTNENARQQQLRAELNAAAGRVPPDSPPGDAGAYFAQHPLPAGTSTADALASLAQFSPHTYDFGAPPTVDFSSGFDANGIPITNKSTTITAAERRRRRLLGLPE